jgi:CheY-like chemotaxis protein
MGLAAQIETAANGKQAIHQLQRNLGIKTHKNNLEGYVFKLIFMDVNMPIMNGFQTTREIVRLYTENQYPIRPYILSYTAYNDFETKQECVLAGSHDVIQKPCPMDLLVSVVEEYYFNAEVIGPKKEGSG